jgi:hypothetical protein
MGAQTAWESEPVGSAEEQAARRRSEKKNFIA